MAVMQTSTEPGTEFGIPSPFWYGRDALVVAETVGGRILGWNPAAAELFGYAEADATTLTLAALLPAHESGGAIDRAAAPTAVAPFDEPRATVARRRSGLDFAIEITATALDSSSGSEGRLLAVFRDLAGRARSEREIERLLEESQALQAVAAALASERDPARLLDGIVERVLAVLGADGCFIWLYDDDGRWRIVAARGLSERYLAGFATTSLDRLSASFRNPVEARRPAFNPDLQGAVRPLNPELADAYQAEGLVSALRLPLFASDDRMDGALVLYHRRERVYSDAEIRLAQAFAHQIAVALQNARLAEKEQQTARELTSLLEISRNLSSTIELEPLLGLILDELKLLVDYTSATAITREGDHYLMRGYRGPLSHEAVRARSLPTAAVDGLIALSPQDTTLIIPDVWADSPAAEAWRATGSEEYLRVAPAYMGCLLNAPLISKGRLIGLLTLGHRTPGYFTEHHAALTQAVAGQVAGLIEHARLFEQEQRTSRELASLLEVSRNVAETLEMEPLLDVILEQLKVAADYGAAAISVVADDRLQELRRRTREGDTPPTREVSLVHAAGWWEPVARGEPVIIDDVQSEEPLAGAYRTTARHAQNAAPMYTVHGFLAVPLTVKDRVMGTIVLSHEQPGYYTERHAALAMALGTQAATAIENARLYGEAQRVAVLEERQRLSRELHDSVSQALFGIGLGARTARTLLQRNNPVKALGSVDYVVSLAEGGMAEMRALLFELRPESLATEGLVAALTKQAAVLTLRHELVVETALGDEPDVSLETKEALFRIAQEALHNIVKHARARTVQIHLSQEDGGIILSVRDDGAGFDPTGSFPGHIGQHSMRERAERLGGTVTVESAVGQGTCIVVRLP
jgi:PAS domain S-box-containing protein